MKQSSSNAHTQRILSIGAAGVLLSVLLVQACSTPTDNVAGEAASGLVMCETPRPEMCTREYRPVCGHVDTGVRCVTSPCPSERHKTYGNACSACAASDVMAYEQGTCESYGK